MIFLFLDILNFIVLFISKNIQYCTCSLINSVLSDILTQKAVGFTSKALYCNKVMLIIHTGVQKWYISVSLYC